MCLHPIWAKICEHAILSLSLALNMPALFLLYYNSFRNLNTLDPTIDAASIAGNNLFASNSFASCMHSSIAADN